MTWNEWFINQAQIAWRSDMYRLWRFYLKLAGEWNVNIHDN